MNPYYKKITEIAKEYKSELITINEEKIRETAKLWAKKDPVVPSWRASGYIDFYPQGDDDDFIQFLGIATAINAYYMDIHTKEKFGTTWNGKIRQGAEAMCASIMRALEQNIPLLSAEFLISLDLKRMKQIFAGNPTMPLISERLKIWNEIGRVLLKEYDGHFRNLFEEANYRCFDNGRGICERLVNDLPISFYDVRPFNSYTIPFHKKALLFPLIYFGRASDSAILPQLNDPESLSDVCDYQVPRTQRHLGHTTYNKKLSNWIAEQNHIPEGHIWEVEIRLSQIKCNDTLHTEINRIRTKNHKKKFLRLHLDFPLWNAGRKIKKIYHHLTKTPSY